MESVVVPQRFGGVRPKPLQHRAKCQACEDFGTLCQGPREPRTVAQILAEEVPCVCSAGDLFKALASEWAKPWPQKRGGKAAA